MEYFNLLCDSCVNTGEVGKFDVVLIANEWRIKDAKLFAGLARDSKLVRDEGGFKMQY